MNKYRQHIIFLKLLIVLTSYLYCGAASSDSTYPESLITESIRQFEDKIVVPVKHLKPGDALKVNYAEFVVYIYMRTAQDLHFLRESSANMMNVDKIRFQKNKRIRKHDTLSNIRNYVIRESQSSFLDRPFRSIRDDIFVVIGEGPKHGFTVQFMPPDYRNGQFDVFMNVAHGQRYDSAGRQISKTGVELNNGENLFIPPHTYNNNGDIVLGGITINRKAAISFPDYHGLSAQEKLWLACHNNDYNSVAEALSQGANPDLKEENGNALDYAITGSDISVIELLLKNGARPTNISRDMATIAKRNDILKLLDKLDSE